MEGQVACVALVVRGVRRLCSLAHSSWRALDPVPILGRLEPMIHGRFALAHLML